MCKCNECSDLTCGSKTSARCALLDNVSVSENSSLTDKSCITVNDAIQDLYELEDNQVNLEDIDVSEFCLTYENNEDCKVGILDILKNHDQLLCDLTENSQVDETGSESGVDSFWNMSLVDSGLDLGCLVPVCGTTISSVKDLFQAIISKTCSDCTNCSDTNPGII